MKDVKVILGKFDGCIHGWNARLYSDGELVDNCVKVEITIDVNNVVTVNGFMVNSLTVLMEDEDERIKGLEDRIRDDYGVGGTL